MKASSNMLPFTRTCKNVFKLYLISSDYQWLKSQLYIYLLVVSLTMLWTVVFQIGELLRVSSPTLDWILKLIKYALHLVSDYKPYGGIQ